MSYLGYPRVNFAGTFQADVATINNDWRKYNNDWFEPRMQRVMNNDNVFGLWNPHGTGSCRLHDIRITGVCGPDGTTTTASADDPVAGGWLIDDNLRTSARFVDLDPQNQNCAMIFGLTVRILDSTGTEAVRGDFSPTAHDLPWERSLIPEGRGDYGATYTSVLTNVTWAKTLTSPVLKALKDATQDGMLSIKFNLDGVEDGGRDGVVYPANVTFGRMVGSIGPYYANEPRYLLAARRLRTTDSNSPLHDALCRVDEASGRIFVDLGNSIMAQTRGGPLNDVGPLRLATLAADGTPQVLASLVDVDTDYYQQYAGIVAAQLNPSQLATVANTRLAVVNNAATPLVWLAENADATMVQSEVRVFRLSPTAPDNTVTTTLYATSYGRPAAGIELVVGPTTLASNGNPVPDPPVKMPAQVRTDADGRAEVTLTALDPGNSRPYVDGAAVVTAFGFANAPNSPEDVLNFLVFDEYRIPDRPTWFGDVQPIFQRYANLYPAMHDAFNLASYDVVVSHKEYIKKTLLAPVESPNHMPVTRDLSPGKRDMIVKWLETSPMPPILEINTVDDLRTALQQAILLEQATMPPYLGALFSIIPGHNQQIADIIRGIALEEMQHMAQVCNILNAVGGQPQIGRPGLVPTYPGHLPGPVLPDLLIRLRKLSIEQVQNVFMAIEQPEYPTVNGLPFSGPVIDMNTVHTDQSGKVTSVDPNSMSTLENWFNTAEHTPQTVGWFYTQIARAVSRLNGQGKLFTGNPAAQVSWPNQSGSIYQVTDLKSALLAIYRIIEQGEGSPHDIQSGQHIDDPDEFGHYYRFEEIVKGASLVKDANGKWSFDGPPIPFDPEGVYPMMDDPDTYALPANSVNQRESEQFDLIYTRLLAALNTVFNGHPDQLDNAVGIMYQAEVQAKKLLSMPSADGASTVLGAAFMSPEPGIPI